MAKGNNAVYRVTDVIGTSSNSWEDAARNAIKLDVKVEDGKITQFRTRLSLSFKYSA
jgi:flavin-binding protein dodecin